VYKITSPAEKIYVGSSTNIHRRHTEYKNLNCEYQFKLYNSLIKYGFENHTVEIIEECVKADLNCRERYWQDFYDVLDREKGLNLALVECGANRRTFSQEARRRYGENQKGSKNPVAVPVINVLTKKEFGCISDARSYEGYGTVFEAKLAGRVTNDTPYIYKKFYEDYLSGLFTNVNIHKDRRLGWEVINILTKEVFKTVKLAAKTCKDYKYRTIVVWLSNPDVNRSPFKYLKDYKEGDTLNIEIPLPTTKKKQVIDKNTLIVYPSVSEASRQLGLVKSTLLASVSRGKHPIIMPLEKFLRLNPEMSALDFKFI